MTLRIAQLALTDINISNPLQQLSTHCRQSIQISEWQHTHGKRAVDFSEPTGTTGQKRSFANPVSGRSRLQNNVPEIVLHI